MGLDGAVRASISAHGADALSRAAARLTRSSSGRVWKGAYGRSSDRFSALVRFADQRPRLVETVLHIQQARQDRDVSQAMALGWMFNLMARFQLASEGDSDLVVIDEGFCQRAVSLFAHGFDIHEDGELLDGYLDQIPLPELLVWVMTTPETAGRRLDGRGWSERMKGGDADRQGFLAGAFEVVELVKVALSDRGVPVIEVDGADDTQMTASRLAADVARRLS